MRMRSWLALVHVVLSSSGCVHETTDVRTDAASDGRTEPPTLDVYDTSDGSMAPDIALEDALDAAQDRSAPPDIVDADLPPSDANDALSESDAPIDGTTPTDGEAGGDRGQPPDDGPPLGCNRTSGRISVSVTLPDGTIEDCAHLPFDAGFPPPLHRVVRGAVNGVRDGGMGPLVTINTCATGCFASIALTGVTDVVIPMGAYVEAEYWVTKSWACIQFLRISNLPEWNGEKNPVNDTNKIYLIASDGLRDPNVQLAVTGITADTNPLSCTADAVISCGSTTATGNYAWKFSHSSSTPTTMAMGENARLWGVNGQNLVIANYRSYESGLCDDYWNWAFTMWAPF
jgi:hypothetical protein